jgi:hypothetical protein
VVVLGNFFVRVELNRHGFINERKKMKRINKVWRLHKKKKTFLYTFLYNCSLTTQKALLIDYKKKNTLSRDIK